MPSSLSSSAYDQLLAACTPILRPTLVGAATTAVAPAPVRPTYLRLASAAASPSR